MRENDPAELRALAQKCRTLAKGVSTRAVASSLEQMADDYERRAAKCQADRKAAGDG